tara:strand:+ start:81 stop:473 length:393 start_codon:yes stop_codon:yes gene_type:complete
MIRPFFDQLSVPENTAYLLNQYIINKTTNFMPLLNSTIIKLNEITTRVKNKNQLSSDDESFIKQIFKEINENGETYDVDEIESWFENEGSWENKLVRNRITNISHYQQSKYEQNNKFRMISDNDSCSCGE